MAAEAEAGKASADEAAALARKARRAAQILLLPRHRRSGVRGWELKRLLGRDYLKALELLDAELERLGLKLKAVREDERGGLEEASFVVSVAEPLTLGDASTAGWRVDEIAVLAVCVAYISSRQGKAPRKEVEGILKAKMPAWRVELALNKLVRRGYLREEEGGLLRLDWRSRAEIDPKALLGLILSSSPGEEKPEGV